MLRRYSAADDISYYPSKWCYDLLPLQDAGNLREGKLITIEVNRRAGPDASDGKLSKAIQNVDKVFAISLEVAIFVSMSSRQVVAYNYKQKFNYPIYKCQYTEKWRDVICVASRSSGTYRSSPIFSLLILTESSKIIKLEMRQDSMTFVEVCRISINSRHEYTQLLLYEPPQEDGPGEPLLYLWTPKRRMIQNFTIVLDNDSSMPLTGKAELTPGKEIKIRNPELNGETVQVDGSALSLSIDSQKGTVLCADRDHHILFECQMQTSGSTVLCGQGKPGRSEENAQSKQAYLHSPCAPLSYYPQDYVEKSRFSTEAKETLSVKRPGFPRIILLCDAGNQAVRKIWQFADSPQAHDLAGYDRMCTLICDSDSKSPLLQLPCEGPKALYVNPCGILTITTDRYAYIIASHGALPEQRTVQSQVPGDT